MSDIEYRVEVRQLIGARVTEVEDCDAFLEIYFDNGYVLTLEHEDVYDVTQYYTLLFGVGGVNDE